MYTTDENLKKPNEKKSSGAVDRPIDSRGMVINLSHIPGRTPERMWA